MTTWLHHPGLVVPDLDAATKFYCAALDYHYVKDFSWGPDEAAHAESVTGVAGTSVSGVVLQGQNGFMELFRFHTPGSTGNPQERSAADFGIAHLAFQVTDIQQAYERFVAAGGIVHNDPVAVGEGYSIYCRDPFGNIIELMQMGGDEPDFDLLAQGLVPARPSEE